jgi:ABC-type transport system substrate-binding protein
MKTSLTRRDFLKYCGVGTAGIAAAAALAGCSSDDSSSEGSSTTQQTTTQPSNELKAGETQQTQVVKDESRETTESTGKRYPCISFPITSDPGDMDVRNYWKKGSVSLAILEGLGEDNKDTNFPDWIMIKSYTQSDPTWVTYSMEKNSGGEDTKWATGVTEVAEGTEGAVEAVYWDIEIFDYIHDHENRNITAEDVIYCYKEELNSGYALKYNAFIWCEATGDYTLRMWFNKSGLEALGSLEFVMTKTAIYSKEGAEAGDYISTPVTTGPYKFVSYVSGSEVVVEAYDDYWQTDDSLMPLTRHATVQTIRFPIITEKSQIVIALETGIANCSSSIGTDDIPTFDEGGEYHNLYNIFRAATAEINGIIFNCYEGHPGADPKFRQGVCYALDSNSIAQGAGASYFALQGPGSYGAPDYDTSMDDDENWQTVYDPDMAKQLIDESTYNGEELVYMIDNTKQHEVNASQVIQILLENVGVKIKINPCDSNVLNADTPNPDKWDLASCPSQGSSIVGGINRRFGRTDFDTKPYIGYMDCVGFQNDDKLFELFNAANAAANFGKEATGELLQYIVDNAYAKFFYGVVTNFVYTNDCYDLALRWTGEPCIWSSQFYVDDQINDISK